MMVSTCKYYLHVRLSMNAEQTIAANVAGILEA
jgi:hypothetical protein